MDKFDFRLFLELKKFIYEKFGIVINNSKYPLFSMKINKLMKKSGCIDYPNYLLKLSYMEDGRILDDLISFVTVNRTEFFRELEQFSYIKRNEKCIREQNPKIDETGEIRVWSSSCSTGQEAYSIAIVLTECFPGSDLKLLASDLDETSLEVARAGRYPLSISKEVPEKYLDRYFKKSEGCYVVRDFLKNKISFIKLNLKDEFPKGKFDMIFCKNTMIYFDEEFCKNLINRFFDSCRDGGLFFVGYAETLLYVETRFKPVCKSIYIKESLQKKEI